MTTLNTGPRQLSDGNPNGTVLGRSSADAIGFYGVATPVVQPSGATSVVSLLSSANALTAQTASAAGFGFSTAAQCAAYLSTVAQMQTDVQNIIISLNALHIACSSTGFTKGS